MTPSLLLHKIIVTCNVLERPTRQLNAYFQNRPEIHKAALIANHIFRAASMAALMCIFPTNARLCFAGSLFYRLTVETHCSYKFALPAFAGSIAFLTGRGALANLTSGAAFASLRTLSATVPPLLPLAAYAVYVVLTVNYDVDHPPRRG